MEILNKIATFLLLKYSINEIVIESFLIMQCEIVSK